MSRLTDLIRKAKAKDPALGADLEAEFRTMSDRRVFGLNFERHRPEAVELPQRTVRKGDKVRVLPPRGSTERGDQRLWRVTGLETVNGARVARLVLLGVEEPETLAVVADDLAVVAEFRDPIYPGLVSTGRVARGGDKPFHSVINAENYHALQTLLYTHRGKVDAIYIDPPYNTGAKDWKYNNDYVDGEDLYRHSKWLAFMERRLLLAKELLNSDDSVLIVTIDEKEYLRLGLLLEQTFPDATMQMVTTCIKPSGSQRAGEFSRVDEYVYFVMLGKARPASSSSDMLRDGSGGGAEAQLTWHGLRRRGSTDWRRAHRPNGFYPVFVEITSGRIHSVGEPIPVELDRTEVLPPSGTFAAWPLDPNGDESRWQISPARLRKQLDEGTAYLRSADVVTGSGSIAYLKSGDLKLLADGAFLASGRESDGHIRVESSQALTRRPKTMWVMDSHDASAYGTALLSRFLPGRKFPFPKSLYAVEDGLRFFVTAKPNATVIDFFSGSGTTAHAIMRLNRQDGGRRRSISLTNNEVSADEQGALRRRGLRPGDPGWEMYGICDHITKPRLEAAVTGLTPTGDSVKGDYKFTDEFPMSEGFEENVEFFTLTYESPWRVARNRDFAAIAPLLWLRAGSQGRRIEAPLNGWDVAETYGVLQDLDQTSAFLARVSEVGSIRVAFVVTNDDRRFQMVCAALPDRVEAVRLYESYLRNFEINAGRE